MKKIFSGLVFFSACAYAALPAGTDPTLIHVPQLPGGFEIGASGYYLEPSDSHGDLNYAFIQENQAYSIEKKVEPGHTLGFDVNLGYVFPNTGNDVRLTYFHLDTDDSDSVSAIAPVQVFPIVLNFFSSTDIDLSSASTSKATAEYDINRFDLTAGQFVNIGCRLITHSYMGLRGATVDRKLTTDTQFHRIQILDVGTIDIPSTQKSDFSGIGPLAGVDASYYLGLGFGFVGHFDAALLVGDIKSNTNFSVIEREINHVASAASNTDDIRRLVPTIDGKLGMDYTLVFNNRPGSNLNFEFGWNVGHYYNVIDKTNFIASGKNKFVTGNRSSSDLTENGPYLSAMYHI